MKHQDYSGVLLAMQTTRASLLEELGEGGRERAWEEFYTRYWGVIMRYAQKLGLEAQDAEDVLQETMVTLMRVLPEFEYDRGRGRFRNFLLTIVHRKSLAALRRARRRCEIPLESEDSGGSGLELSRRIASDCSGPERSDEMAWRQSVMEEAVQRLRRDGGIREETLGVFVACVLEGRPVPEVAASFGVSRNNVYQIKNRMMRRLKEEIEGLQEGSGEVGGRDARCGMRGLRDSIRL